jgi:hypothetical protein
MTPRLPLTSIGYAFTADTALSLSCDHCISPAMMGFSPDPWYVNVTGDAMSGGLIIQQSADYDALNVAHHGIIGAAGSFTNYNPSNTTEALHARHFGNGHAIYCTSGGSVQTLFSHSTGPGSAVYGETDGTGSVAQFYTKPSSNNWPTLTAYTAGVGPVATFYIQNTQNTDDVLVAITNGIGRAGYFQGDVHVTGNLSAGGTKPFVQPHAKDPSKEIVYIAAEGPEAVVFLRGVAQLKKGKAVIELPEHFQMVVAEESVQVQVTPLEDCNGLYVAGRNKDKIEIRELMAGKRSVRFNYLISAIRAGFEKHEPVAENTHFTADNVTKAEFEQRYSKDDMSTLAIRNLLISNGILTKDGKLNMGTVKKLGWILKEADFAKVDQSINR